MVIVIAIIFIGAVVTAISFFIFHCSKSRNPCGKAIPKVQEKWFYWGSASELSHDLLGYMTTCVRKYGKIFQMTVVGMKVIVITDPDLVQECTRNRTTICKHFESKNQKWFTSVFGPSVFTMTSGPEHDKQRRYVLPTFTIVLRHILNSSLTVLNKLLSQMEQWASQHQVVELIPHLKNLTLDLFGIAAFSYDFRSLDVGFSSQLKNYNYTQKVMAAFETVTQETTRILNLSFLPLVGTLLSIPARIRLRKAERICKEFVYSLIQRRLTGRKELQRDQKSQVDLLSLMMQINKEGNGLSYEEIVANFLVYTFLG
jgi:cytochrome P450